MSKTSIDRKALTQKALSAVRQEPGCEGVTRVSITPVTIVNDGSKDWHLRVVEPGNVKADAAYHAASKVKDMLAAQFELSED